MIARKPQSVSSIPDAAKNKKQLLLAGQKEPKSFVACVPIGRGPA
jgi:hypothetical protein